MKITATSKCKLEYNNKRDDLCCEASLHGMPNIKSKNRLSKDLRTLLWIPYAAQHQDQLEQMEHKEVNPEVVDQTMRAILQAGRHRKAGKHCGW